MKSIRYGNLFVTEHVENLNKLLTSTFLSPCVIGWFETKDFS